MTGDSIATGERVEKARPKPLVTRLTAERRLALGIALSVPELLFLAGAIALLLVATVPNLANYPGVTDDEIWILNASHNLAQNHVFGTDLFKGFWRAEEVYLFNMPLHHIVLAGVFKVFGTSIFIARFVSVLYGVATILLVYAFARQMRGVAVAVLAVVLLLLLRLHLAFDYGLPLQEMSSSIRYDLAPVPFMLLGALVMLRPTLLRCAIAGGLFAIATLNQFYGAFMFPVAAIYLFLESGPIRERVKLVAAVAVVAFIVVLPYGVYVLSNYEEYQGQTSTLYRRLDLTDPRLYWENINREDMRFRLQFGDSWGTLTSKPSAKAALLIAMPASLLYLAWRVRKFNQRGDRMLLLSLALVPLLLVLIDFQKITYYWIAVVPFLCLAIAATAVAAFERARSSGGLHWAGLAAVVPALVAALLIGGVVTEGVSAQVKGLRNQDATNFMSLRPLLASYIPPGSRVLGATNFWWAMPDTDFRSYYMLYYRTNPQTTDDVTSVGGYLDEFGAEYVVLNYIARLFMPSINPILNEYLESRGEQIAFLPDKTYGFIEIWRINRSN